MGWASTTSRYHLNMNKCLYCKSPVKVKYCSVSCQNSHLNSIRAEKRMQNQYGKIISKTSTCIICSKEFKYSQREAHQPKRFCCMSCRNAYSQKHTNYEKTRKVYCAICNVMMLRSNVASLHRKTFCEKCKVIHYNKRCKICNALIKITSKYCDTCRKAVMLRASAKGGRSSATSQNRRSKNEICFYDLCKSHFKHVEHNTPIFNGWDADVIIHDIKTAVLWNGNWHRKKLNKLHSVKQVKNRDRIKIKEIVKAGYAPYVINDHGKFNRQFVQRQFKKFIQAPVAQLVRALRS